MAGGSETTDWVIPELDLSHAPPARPDLLAPRVRTPPAVRKKRPSRVRRRLLAHDRRAAQVHAELKRKPLLWLERFPVTIILGLQYGLLVVRPAIQHHTQPEGLIVKICLAGVGIAFVIEALLLPLSRGIPHGRSIVGPWSAMAVFVIGAAATALASLFGAGSYAVQIGTTSGSRVAAFFTPFTYWMLFGVLLTLWLYSSDQLSRKRAGWVLVFAFSLQGVLSFRQGFLSPLLSLALPVFVAVLLARLIRVRWLIALLLIATLAAPSLLNLRNHRRESLGATVGQEGTSSLSARLRLDQEMNQILLLPSAPMNVGQASVPLLIRFGIFPRALDRNRTNLNTGELLSVAIGGTSTNSAALTPFGEAYAFSSWEGLTALVGLSTLAMAAVIRRRRAWSFLAVGILVGGALSIFGSYPDQLAQVLQALESLSVAMAFCWLMRACGWGRQSRRFTPDLHSFRARVPPTSHVPSRTDRPGVNGLVRG